MTPIRSTVRVLGDDISTDDIISGRYCDSFDPNRLAPHVFEALGDKRPRLRPGDVIVAGANFGCGSAREHAPIALLAAGVKAVVAASFGRIFFRNAVNVNLPVLTCRELDPAGIDGQVIEIDLDTGSIRAGTAQYAAEPVPALVREIRDHGGLVQWVRRQVVGAPGVEPPTSHPTSS